MGIEGHGDDLGTTLIGESARGLEQALMGDVDAVKIADGDDAGHGHARQDNADGAAMKGVHLGRIQLKKDPKSFGSFGGVRNRNTVQYFQPSRYSLLMN